MLSSQGWGSKSLSFGRTSRQCLLALGALCVASHAGANPVYKCERLKESELAHGGYFPGAINDADEVVGDALGFLAFKWNKQREAQELQKDRFAMATYVNAINNGGVTVGASNIEGPHPEGLAAYKWLPDGSFVKLSKYSGQHTFAADINDLGVIAGWVSTDGLAEATLWTTDTRQKQLPALEAGKSAYANQLNNHGVVVGEAKKTVDGQEVDRAVRWHGGEVRDLGSLPGMNSSKAYSISDHGLIVGVSADSAVPNATAPVAWVNGGAIQALNLGGSTSGSAVSVNRHGVVIGYTSALGPTYWADVNASPLKVDDLIAADKPCRGPDGQAAQLTGVQAINSRGAIAASGHWAEDGGSTVTGVFRLVPMKVR